MARSGAASLVSPSPATASSRANFVCPSCSISSSIVSLEISFTTSTSRFCPIRYARSCAWRSLWGLKSWSNLDPMSANEIVFRIVNVHYDDGGSRQIDTHAWKRINIRPPIKEKIFTSCLCWQQKDGDWFVVCKFVHKCLPDINRCASGKKQKLDAIDFQDCL